MCIVLLCFALVIVIVMAFVNKLYYVFELLLLLIRAIYLDYVGKDFTRFIQIWRSSSRIE